MTKKKKDKKIDFHIKLFMGILCWFNFIGDGILILLIAIIAAKNIIKIIEINIIFFIVIYYLRNIIIYSNYSK